jgi:CheY-like chemotaxis protein
MRRAVRRLLEERNSKVVIHEAVDGLDAVEKAEKLKPDLIVLDFSMPGLNGVEAATAIKKILPDIPIVMFTLFGEAVGTQCSDLGVDVFSKSDGCSKLLERLDQLFPPNLVAGAG